MMPALTSKTELWDRLAKTDPAHTKSFTRGGGFRGTAIRPHWAVYRATQEFGPCGIGWGWTVHDTKIEAGMVFCLVSIWYCGEDGKRYNTGAQWGGTAILEKRKDGTERADDESFKKSVTDGITKCLSYIGIGADVHLGQFDDTKYVDEVKGEFDAAKADEAVAKTNATDQAFVRGAVAALKIAATVDDLVKLGRTHAKRLAEIRQRSPALADEYKEAGLAMRKKLAPPDPESTEDEKAQAAE